MSALLDSRLPEFRALPMEVADLPDVIPVELRAYTMPWSFGNFVDSIAAGYPTEVLRDSEGRLLGYWVAMVGVDEIHLLNITVAPEWQGRGLAPVMLDSLVGRCRALGLTQLWLEVRKSNERAQAVYARYGMQQVGRRKAYYPMPDGSREDALLMSLDIPAEATP
jgi:ribosomal-protein-alanine N-acetyltransferase